MKLLLLMATLSAMIVAQATEQVTEVRDVIIIGAGMAGIAASKVLNKKKISHIIIESRDRIGGEDSGRRDRWGESGPGSVLRALPLARQPTPPTHHPDEVAHHPRGCQKHSGVRSQQILSQLAGVGAVCLRSALTSNLHRAVREGQRHRPVDGVPSVPQPEEEQLLLRTDEAAALLAADVGGSERCGPGPDLREVLQR